ncbi:hypothetical protein ACH4UM_34830 [Streptomyces sp. NPDC020801]
MEPRRCAGLSWHPGNQLPYSTAPYNTQGTSHHLKGKPFSVYGWERPA